MMNKANRRENYYKLIDFILDCDREGAFNVARELLREDGGKHIMGNYEDITLKRKDKHADRINELELEIDEISTAILEASFKI